MTLQRIKKMIEPEQHQHRIADIEGLQTALNNSGQATMTKERDIFEATAMQRLFTLSSRYAPNSNLLNVTVGGVPQVAGVHFTETSEQTFELSEGVPAGVAVVAEYYSGFGGLVAIPNATDQQDGLMTKEQALALIEQGTTLSNMQQTMPRIKGSIYQQNLNTITSIGFYDTADCANAPEFASNYGFLEVIASADGLDILQRLTDKIGQYADVTFQRERINGSWGAWKRAINATDLKAAAYQEYEVGNFTPKLVGNGHQYYKQHGKYVRTGRTVYIEIILTLKVLNTSTVEAVYIQGLPFTEGGGGGGAGLALGYIGGLSSGEISGALARVVGSDVLLYCKRGAATNGYGFLETSNLTNDFDVRLSGTYVF